MLESVETGTNRNRCSTNLFYSLSAFAGITSIVNRKAWTNALRVYRLIIAVLQHNLYSNGAKTYEELNVYLETAREHPTGR